MSTQHEPEAPVLRLRITHITSTMSPPLPSLFSSYMPPHLATSCPTGVLPAQVPVIRIFGTTPCLQKICANIHLCYPYFFVPFPMDSTDPLRPERVIKLCQRFAVSLNHAICLAMRQNPTAQSNSSKYGGGADPKHLHVASVMLVKGTPFYGYHIGYSYFLKVSLVNPSRLYVALEQLRKPVVLGREWQPHEAHMNHVLQFMSDFDLYGCGWLDLGGGTFRTPLPEGDPYGSPPDSQGPPDIFNSLTVPQGMLYPPSVSPPKDTFTPLEIDVLPHHILNRLRLKPRNLHHDFIELRHRPLDPDEKLVPAVAELWDDERRRRAMKGLSLSETAMMPGSGGMGGRTPGELGYKTEGDISTENKENKGGNWKITDELWEIVQERMDKERRRKGRLTFDRFVGEVRGGPDGEKRKWDKWVPTTFQAVSAHWPKQPDFHRSTQRSRKSRNTAQSSSQAFASSPLGNAKSSPSQHHPGPLLVKIEQVSHGGTHEPEASPSKSNSANGHVKEGEIGTPVNQGLPVGGAGAAEAAQDDEADDWDVLFQDEDNPFDAFALSQASRDFPDLSAADVNQNMISRAVEQVREGDVDEEDGAREQHQRDARQHAEQGARIRATQAPLGDDEDDGYDDEELDELFRQTIAAGWGEVSTPRKPRVNGSLTPTTGSRTELSSAGPSTRRARYEMQMREQAGLGDLSAIMERSSVSLSSPSNPFEPHLQTPSKLATPASDKQTPTSLVRNLFARNRDPISPLQSLTKRLTGTLANTVVLPPPKRSLGNLSPTPEDEEEREPTPTPRRPKRVRESYASTGDVKPNIGEMELAQLDSGDIQLPPPYQTLRSSKSSTEASAENPKDTVRQHGLPSPTLVNGSPTLVVPNRSEDVASGGSGESQDGSRTPKRVRLASPDSQLAPLAPLNSSQKSADSDQTSTSAAKTTFGPTGLLASTAPSNVSSTSWQFHLPPPLARHVTLSMNPEVVYQKPFYSDPTDVPSRAKMFAGKLFTLKGSRVEDLEDFESSIAPRKHWLKTRKMGSEKARYGWEYAPPPPLLESVLDWCKAQQEAQTSELEARAHSTSQLAGPTQKSRFGFKTSQKKKGRDSQRETQNMSVLAIEVFSTSRHQLLPDPEKDEITAVFFCYQNEDETLEDTTVHPGYHAGFVAIDSPQLRQGRIGMEGVPCHVVDGELDLINWMIDTVKYWDPDVLAGWELHNQSWGYLSARAHEAFGIDLVDQLSRVVSGHAAPRKDAYSAHHSSTFKVSGRHILNIWRICRSEIILTQYSFENIVFHLLHQRIPHYSAATLTALWKSKTPEHTLRVLRYFFQRAVIDIELVDAAEIITKNAEFARVFGVDFASVMFRGSQYKVESFMFRIAKPESFVLVSPSKEQVGLQNAPFAVPLIAEPESKYYTHPILVLDFQSLYPSVMIAYNICYSTCLGRVEKFKGTDKFGFTELKVADGLLELLKDYLTITPNGMIFVKPAVRKSLLSKMLGEILDTRVMVKHAMKHNRGNKSLLSLLNARQLGLKLMANVTYGYTSATYSGRMPCIEVADSIVQTGRETLEKAQELIHSRADWGAQVVYGDTDSLFVALPGRSKDQAFIIGNKIADAVTEMNPKPIKLKFEKVYMGSVLMAKKRYVGFKYEHPDETEPVFDAKGIETIRRDGFPAQGKMEEVCLKMLFRSQDLSQIKEYCRQEWTKILQGRVSLQDFIVAKEVRLGTYSDKGVPPPGAAVAYRRILKDPRDEPQYAERVPYIISNADGRRLIDRARMPQEMLANRALNIDAEYYIRNLLIPPLSRIFNLVGADVEAWFETMPRVKRVVKYESRLLGKGKGKGKSKMRIDGHFTSSHCMVCGTETAERICAQCVADPSDTTHALLSRLHLAQRKLVDTHKICASCSSTPVHDKIMCDSIDCPVLYTRIAAGRDVDDLANVPELIAGLETEADDEIQFVGSTGLDW